MRSAAVRPLGQVQVGMAMFSATVSSPNTSLSSGAKPMPDARPERSQGREAPALEGDRAGQRLAETHDAAERGGLAGAVAPDQADQLALAHLERDAAQDAAALDVDDEIADLPASERPPPLADHGFDQMRIGEEARGGRSASTPPSDSAMMRCE